MPKDKNVVGCDVLVLGGGVAGLVAAQRAADLGASVVLVDFGAGASLQASGAIDLGLNQAHATEHPYTRLCHDDFAMRDAAVNRFAQLLGEEGGLCSGAPMALATQMGTIKHTDTALMSQRLDLHLLDRPLVVVGFENLHGFDAAATARLLAFHVQQTLGKNLSVSSTVVPAASSLVFRAPIEMARWLDEEGHQDVWLKQLEKAAQSNDAVLLLPAVLGTKSFDVWKRAAKTAPVYELLAMPHAATGVRMRCVLFNNLKGVRTVLGQIQKTQCADNLVTRVVVKSNDGQTEFEPRTVVLATGRFLSGGFTRQNDRTESLFGLPLFARHEPIGSRHATELVGAQVFDTHELFHAGLKTDEKLRPLDRFGAVFANNLFAAGSSLGGYDPAVSGTGLGVPIVTGYVAASHAAKS